MYCRKCGKELQDDANFCVYCGAAVQANSQQPQSGNHDEFFDAPYSGESRAATWNAMSVAGFVCSFFFALLGLIFSIIGKKQCKRSGEKGQGLATAGIVISIVSMALSVLLKIWLNVIFSSLFY